MEDLRFKFRVWDKKQKKLAYPNDNPYHNMEMVNYLLFVNNSNLKWDINNYELMQCTGLKDKKGELVYFNDFIKLDDGIVCIIKQIEDINDIEYGRVVAIPVFCLGKKYQTRYIPTIIAEGEKVGNFYENPELLESEEE